MFSLGELFWLAMVFLVALHFWRTQGVRQTALQVTRNHCQREGLLFLDESVALRAVWFKRDAQGNLCFWRRWVFEFTVTGGERYVGDTITLGNRVAAVNLPPHREPERAPDRSADDEPPDQYH